MAVQKPLYYHAMDDIYTFCLSISILFFFRHAYESSKHLRYEYVHLTSPRTIEHLILHIARYLGWLKPPVRYYKLGSRTFSSPLRI